MLLRYKYGMHASMPQGLYFLRVGLVPATPTFVFAEGLWGRFRHPSERSVSFAKPYGTVNLFGLSLTGNSGYSESATIETSHAHDGQVAYHHINVLVGTCFLVE